VRGTAGTREREYDWGNKITFSLNVGEIGKLLSGFKVGAQPPAMRLLQRTTTTVTTTTTVVLWVIFRRQSLLAVVGVGSSTLCDTV
jgi:hypothetical protein